MNKAEIISYLLNELEECERIMHGAQGERNRIAAEAQYGLIFMICNDLGIAE